MPRITESSETASRFSVAQAARELGISAVVLSKQLRRKRIEPADGKTYSLRQIVDSQLPGDSPAEESLKAHGELLRHKSRLALLEVAEKENRLIDRGEVMAFVRELMRAIYDAVHFSDTPERDRLEHSIQDAAVECYAYYGWALEPQTVFATNGEGPPPTRRAKWASLICAMVARAKEDHDHGEPEEERDFGRAGIKSGRRRDIRTRVERDPAVDSAGV